MKIKNIIVLVLAMVLLAVVPAQAAPPTAEFVSFDYDWESMTIEARVVNQTPPYGWTVYPTTTVNHTKKTISIWLYKFGSECHECGRNEPPYDYVRLSLPMTAGAGYKVYVNGTLQLNPAVTTKK